jgi:GT2 family glycosyltransferase
MERLIELPTSPAPRVSIIIVATRQPILLTRCLESVASSATAVPFETIVVLNDAIPEVRALVCERVSGVTVITSLVPLGLAGGLNRGRAAARGELLALFHDDSEAQPGWLDALVAAADSHPEAGAFGSRQLHSDGTPQCSGSVLWRDGTTTNLGTEPETDASESKTMAVDYCGTACLLVRAATWDAIGGADERFYPVYYVDVDLCFSIWSLNQAVLCTTASRVRHRRGASTAAPFREFLMRHNRERLREKWGTKLDVLEPLPADHAAGVPRALEQAHTRWRRAQPPATRSPSEPRSRLPFDTVGQELRVLKIALDLERAWAAELSVNLQRVTAERDRALLMLNRDRGPQIYRRLRSRASRLFRQLIRLTVANRTK